MQDRPLSPCVKVCVLDEAGFCTGCWRSVDEIARWMSLSAAEQWALIASLAERRKALELQCREGKDA